MNNCPKCGSIYVEMLESRATCKMKNQIWYSGHCRYCEYMSERFTDKTEAIAAWSADLKGYFEAKYSEDMAKAMATEKAYAALKKRVEDGVKDLTFENIPPQNCAGGNGGLKWNVLIVGLIQILKHGTTMVK